MVRWQLLMMYVDVSKTWQDKKLQCISFLYFKEDWRAHSWNARGPTVTSGCRPYLPCSAQWQVNLASTLWSRRCPQSYKDSLWHPKRAGNCQLNGFPPARTHTYTIGNGSMSHHVIEFINFLIPSLVEHPLTPKSINNHNSLWYLPWVPHSWAWCTNEKGDEAMLAGLQNIYSQTKKRKDGQQNSALKKTWILFPSEYFYLVISESIIGTSTMMAPGQNNISLLRITMVLESMTFWNRK